MSRSSEAYQEQQEQENLSGSDLAEYEEQYGEYIMNNCAGDRVISNGNDLLKAIEEGYLYAEFINSKD